ncbi:hypothetical protein RI367_001431 [Sorochytrium milnesiophthora]
MLRLLLLPPRCCLPRYRSRLLSTQARVDGILACIPAKAQVVTLATDSHGSQDLSDTRAQVTRRLITERDFGVVAWEADFPQTYMVHRYIHGSSDSPASSARDVLANEFNNFPAWLWQNDVTVSFVEWLKAHNAQHVSDPKGRVHLYGLDVFGLNYAVSAVLRFLSRYAPDEVDQVRKQLAPIEQFGTDTLHFGLYARTLIEDERVNSSLHSILANILANRQSYMAATHGEAHEFEEQFINEMNMKVIMDAYEYYKVMFENSAQSFNVRCNHMFHALNNVIDHVYNVRYNSTGTLSLPDNVTPDPDDKPAKKQLKKALKHAGPKAVIWTHTRIAGDSRATDGAAEKSLGTHLRDRYGKHFCNIALVAQGGSVLAARNWDKPHEVVPRPTLPRDSLQQLIQQQSSTSDGCVRAADLTTSQPCTIRHIGAVYDPDNVDGTTGLQHITHVAQWADAVALFPDSTAPLQCSHPINTLGEHESTPDAFPTGF